MISNTDSTLLIYSTEHIRVKAYTGREELNQQLFHSPEEASAALFAAAQQTDNRALLEILGPRGRTSSPQEILLRIGESAKALLRNISRCIVLRKSIAA